MADVVRVELGERGYDICIAAELHTGMLSGIRTGSRCLIVSDSNVDPLYGSGLSEMLVQSGHAVRRAVIQAGEASKDLRNLEGLYAEALSAGLDRSGTVIALGGGVIGDLAGFLAATYMRGIHFIQVPTSLLAMVDSSVGGKTAVNLEQGKNLVGAFYQPEAVWMALSSLDTLPEREYRSGIAEIIKYGIISDVSLFTMLEQRMDALLRRDFDVLSEVVARSCEIKAEVVAADEREGGLRAILNFGHTLGHALEQTLGYGRLLHGEAVAIGMVYAARISELVEGLPGSDVERIINLLKQAGLPVALPSSVPDWNEIRAVMSADKKSVGTLPRFVLADSIGQAVFGRQMDEATLSGVFGEM